MINKKIYQTWKHRKLPSAAQRAANRMLSINPSFTHEVYDDSDIFYFIKENYDTDALSAYESLNAGAAKADFWRYCVLYTNGGIYLDIDSEILSNLDELIRPEDKAIISRELNFGLFVQWCLMFEAGHPILAKTIDKCIYNIKNRTTDNIFYATGPRVYSEAVKEVVGIEGAYKTDDDLINDTQNVCRFYDYDYGKYAIYEYDHAAKHNDKDFYSGSIQHWKSQSLFKPSQKKETHMVKNKKDKKIIISVLAGGSEHYEKMEDAARDTCFKDPPDNISIYYVHNRRAGIDSDVGDGESKLIDNCFIYGHEDAGRVHLLRKCVEFWGYCLENLDFDYIFRPNLGCWVSMDALNKLVNTLSMEGVWGGAFGTTKGRRRGLEFISGSGFLLSRDVVQLIWDYHLNDKDLTIEYNGNSLVDDVAIGAFITGFRCHPHKGINIDRTLLPRIDIRETEICASRIDPDCHHYYFLHPKSPNCYYLMQAAITEANHEKQDE